MVFIVGNCTQHNNDEQRKVPIYGILGPSGPMSGATPDDISISYLELLQPPKTQKNKKRFTIWLFNIAMEITIFNR